MRPAPTEDQMAVQNVTERLARAAARRRWLVIGGWTLAVLASAAAIGGLLGSSLTSDDDFTGSPEAQRAEQVLHRAFPPREAGRGFRADEAVFVGSADASTGDPRFERRMTTLAAALERAGA